MGRKLGSKDKRKRARKLSPYEAYKKHYARLTKGDKQAWFKDMYTEKEFEEKYENIRKYNINMRKAGLDAMHNPALSIAQAQRHIDRSFDKKYYELTNRKVTKEMVETAEARNQMFLDYVDAKIAEGMTFDEARDEFESYMY